MSTRKNDNQVILL